jgi:hypothetical protein
VHTSLAKEFMCHSFIGPSPQSAFLHRSEHLYHSVQQGRMARVAKLGGPTEATLADALTYYAGQWTVNKGGARAELNRINHYRSAAGLTHLALKKDAKGAKSVVETAAKVGPSAFEAYGAERRELRRETYQSIGKLANRRCSSISTADIRELMSTMSREGLSDSTIQKEIALLRHLFNTAVAEWSWVGLKNPCLGLKLGKSESRFVVLPSAKVQALMEAAAGCDNPLVAAGIGLALDTANRPPAKRRWTQHPLHDCQAAWCARSRALNREPSPACILHGSARSSHAQTRPPDAWAERGPENQAGPCSAV